MSPKPSYEERFSGRTRAILLTLGNLFLDTGLDIRSKHMFGHKAFYLNGRPFCLVGEWARQEDPKKDIVSIAARGPDESTLIVIPLDESMALALRQEYGGLYFAPRGTRLKHWISLTGPWLTDEQRLLPLMQTLVQAYAVLPENPKATRNSLKRI